MRQIFSQESHEYGDYRRARRGWTKGAAFGTAAVILAAAFWLWPSSEVTRTEDATAEALPLIEAAAQRQRGQGNKRPSLQITAPQGDSDPVLLSADRALDSDDNMLGSESDNVEAASLEADATERAKQPKGKTKRNEKPGQRKRTTTTSAQLSSSLSTTTEGRTTTTDGSTTSTSRPTETTARQTTTERRTTTTVRSTTTAAPTTQRRTTTTARTTTTQRATTTTQRQTTTTQNSGGACFRRVMRDDFSGSELSSHWSAYNNGGNAGYGLRRPSAIEVRDGKLIITPKNNSDGVLVSGGMSHNHLQKYGKYRFRVRTDADDNAATSGVILTWPESGNNERDGENNIYETLWDEPNRNPFFSFIHEPFQHSGPTQQAWLPHYADGTQWQTMTMEWTPSEIRVVREGPGQQNWNEHIVKEKSDDDVIPDVRHRLTVQLDAWKHSSHNTVRMEVDWIEVYEYCG